MPLGRGSGVIKMTKGYSTFQYRKSPKHDYWEEKGPNSIGWNRIRTPNSEATAMESIKRLENQGYSRE